MRAGFISCEFFSEASFAAWLAVWVNTVCGTRRGSSGTRRLPSISHSDVAADDPLLGKRKITPNFKDTQCITTPTKSKTAQWIMTQTNFKVAQYTITSNKSKAAQLVCCCFEPGQLQRIISGLKTNFNLSPIYPVHKSLNHKTLFFRQTTTLSNISQINQHNTFHIL